MKIAFYGSSLLSSYWNGAATYYRGLLHALSRRGYHITFYEPDVYERQQNRDMDEPDWCRVVVYPGTSAAVQAVTRHAADADIVVVASGIGFEDDTIRRLVYGNARPGAARIFWDVDAPATLQQLAAEPDHQLHTDLRQIDMVLTYGGGEPVIEGYRAFGARDCIPIYNALDPDTHHPVPPTARFNADLSFLGNRLPDREARVDEFFFEAARAAPQKAFLLGGSGWGDKVMPRNVHLVGHVRTVDHNAFNVSPLAVLNINRESMARNGFSPATRVFEAAGAGACLITDDWVGLDLFLKDGEEVFAARDGKDVADILQGLTPDIARAVGQKALERVRREHTYEQRAEKADTIFRRFFEKEREVAVG
ncbi:CgeB family protein [Aquamicrobium zhengzhouense]|uniref:Glycosyltransferase n=1 Tax=Aquamicrobium zhengzhouense TaxID=2781738 RepID=A0ABS0SFS2_9HYPH|nr:glycosyltransferase [Aquamicrobium zhengzhouense]MBI1621278.1 glycosyltransferase [Aquamicrobium zhengzhouense]